MWEGRDGVPVCSSRSSPVSSTNDGRPLGRWTASGLPLRKRGDRGFPILFFRTRSTLASSVLGVILVGRAGARPAMPVASPGGGQGAPAERDRGAAWSALAPGLPLPSLGSCGRQAEDDTHPPPCRPALNRGSVVFPLHPRTEGRGCGGRAPRGIRPSDVVRWPHRRQCGMSVSRSGEGDGFPGGDCRGEVAQRGGG